MGPDEDDDAFERCDMCGGEYDISDLNDGICGDCREENEID